MGLGGQNISMAKRAVSWAMFINIVIVPVIIGLGSSDFNMYLR